jgi:hypothetical protein
MILLVSGTTKTVGRLLGHPNLGVLITPNDGNVAPDEGVTWAADNSAFSGFDDEKFRRMLKRIKGRKDCQFVTAPDVVGDHEETLGLWKLWHPIIRNHGLLPAFVCQDGCCEFDVPWGDFRAVGESTWPELAQAAIFIGGTNRYKFSEEACLIVRRALRLQMWVHVGRVNSVKRLLFCLALGVSSVDGSSFSRFGETHIPWALRIMNQQQINWNDEYDTLRNKAIKAEAQMGGK